ncbi:MAG: helix-turn-helix transcriptional regulator [Thermoplasmata archaeon]|nr:helix-turn-helix transcriptional regulator [Thermoplasmata archaeon]
MSSPARAKQRRTDGRADRSVQRELSCMIEVDGASYCIDPAGGIAEALGKKWTLPLIGLLGNRPKHRFGELLGGLEGVGSKALADRLHDLQRLGLVSREVFAEVPARVEYRLTERGLELRRALVPLLAWAAQEGSGLRTLSLR